MAKCTFEPLSKDNFGSWRMQMEALLIETNGWPHVEGTILKPEPLEGDTSNALDIKAWTLADQKAYSDLILSISPSELRQVKYCRTSRELWLKLESIYQSKDPARKTTLLKQLTLARMSEGEDIGVHLDNFFSAVDKLKNFDLLIPDDLLAIFLLYSLPASLENFRCAIESRDELPSLDTLRIKVEDEYDAMHKVKTLREDAFNTGRNDRWKKTKNSRGTSKLKCHRCRMVGHKAAKCRAPTPVVAMAGKECLYF